MLSERGGLTRKAWAWPRDGGHAHVMRRIPSADVSLAGHGSTAAWEGEGQAAGKAAGSGQESRGSAGWVRERGRLAGSEAHLWVGCVTPMQQQQQAVAGDVCLLMVPSERGGLTGKVWA